LVEGQGQNLHAAAVFWLRDSVLAHMRDGHLQQRRTLRRLAAMVVLRRSRRAGVSRQFAHGHQIGA
jgi:hypothetical protein